MSDFHQIHTLYNETKADRQRYVPLWQTISRFVGIQVDIDYLEVGQNKNQSRQLDDYVDDPTAAISVTQSGDYLFGIMWATGDDVLELEPSREVLDIANAQTIAPYYTFCTSELLYQMNHPDAGFGSALKSYIYDQRSFGTSGIGAFKNKQAKIEGNEIIYKNYGVDTMCIEEGKSGLVDTVFITYHWKVNQIVSEFCCDENGLNEKLLKKQPQAIQDAWKEKRFNTQFTLVFGVMPRANYDPKKKGKLATRYRGVWFYDSLSVKDNNSIFLEEDFATKPIAVARAVKVRGSVYGRASGTMLISTIRLVNFMVGQAIEAIEKLVRPSLGIYNNGLFGDAVLDTSPDGLTVFNPEMTAGGSSPIFPVADVGDPTPLLNFLLPYLNEKIATAFKIDVLLDFSSAKEMTATESLQRFAIRGKALAGDLTQQKTECLDVVIPRSIDLCMQAGRLGIDPAKDKKAAESLTKLRKTEKIIPPEVLQCIAEGKPWYKIKYKNELEQLTNTRNVESLLQFTQGTGVVSSLYPQIIKSVNWYKLLNDFRKSLNIPADEMISEDDFKAIIEKDADAAEAALATQLGEQSAAAEKNLAQAEKSKAEAKK